MEEHGARIQWISPPEGGRQVPFSGTRYSAVAKFESLKDKWPEEAWSVVLYISSPVDVNRITIAKIEMLIGNAAPSDLLSSGSKFELYEGWKCVARGEVI